MARNPVRDERQGDLFGTPPPPAKSARRACPPMPPRKKTPAPEPMSLGNLGARTTRPEIDEFLDGLPDQDLAYLVVEATRIVKRRLARGQGRGLRSRGFRSGTVASCRGPAPAWRGTHGNRRAGRNLVSHTS
jgi:hypothetical protein